MSNSLSPNMNLPIPGVGTEAGPDYALDINAALTIIDQHTHTNGSGVQITSAAININAALTFANNFATNVAGVTLYAQSGAPGNNTIYESGTDLYFVDGSGNNVRITQSGGVAGSPGSISNLISPASAAYVSGSSKFVWSSVSSIAADMDMGSAIMRNISPNSTYALTLQPPAALAANYSITLPALPAATSFMTMTTGGVIGSTALLGVLTTANLSASANILGSQLSATAGIVGGQISSSAALSIASLAASGAISAAGAIITNITAGNVSASTQIRLGGQNVIVANTNNISQDAYVRGYVQADCVGIYSGTGFSVSTSGVGIGEARITYTTPFDDIPAVTVTPVTNNTVGLQWTIKNDNVASAFNVRFYDASGTPLSGTTPEFHFHAIGRKA